MASHLRAAAASMQFHYIHRLNRIGRLWYQISSLTSNRGFGRWRRSHRPINSVASHVAFLLRVEVIGVTAATGVSELRAQSSGRIEKEARNEGSTSAGSFGLHTRRFGVGFANQLLQSFIVRNDLSLKKKQEKKSSLLPWTVRLNRILFKKTVDITNQ